MGRLLPVPLMRFFLASHSIIVTTVGVGVKRNTSIGIKLRGSDKQSSIWHHKEKE
jgi:hypothetical protein